MSDCGVCLSYLSVVSVCLWCLSVVSVCGFCLVYVCFWGLCSVSFSGVSLSLLIDLSVIFLAFSPSATG